MKIWLIFWLLCVAAFASDFITKNEYARMLYQNLLYEYVINFNKDKK